MHTRHNGTHDDPPGLASERSGPEAEPAPGATTPRATRTSTIWRPSTSTSRRAGEPAPTRATTPPGTPSPARKPAWKRCSWATCP
jgi:hypothetical protein